MILAAMMSVVPLTWDFGLEGGLPTPAQDLSRSGSPDPQPPEVMYLLSLDIGEVARGYHLIARSVSLKDENLLFEYVFALNLPMKRAAKALADSDRQPQEVK